MTLRHWAKLRYDSAKPKGMPGLCWLVCLSSLPMPCKCLGHTSNIQPRAGQGGRNHTDNPCGPGILKRRPPNAPIHMNHAERGVSAEERNSAPRSVMERSRPVIRSIYHEVQCGEGKTRIDARLRYGRSVSAAHPWTAGAAL